jgi:signal transduction histidine kinase
VELRCSPGGDLLLRVDNAAPATGSSIAPGSGGGLGIVGMQERASASGGSIRTGPRADGGFSVCVEWAGTQPHRRDAS